MFVVVDVAAFFADEFVTATGPVSGGIVPIEGELLGSGLQFSYTDRPAPSATAGVATFQVIRMPVVQDLIVTAAGEIIPETWDGSSGGGVAFDQLSAFAEVYGRRQRLGDCVDNT